MTSKRAILIAGPTASGKSSIALHLAQELGGVIINADSMQVYKDLDIITARPGPAEREASPHALYGILDGADHFSVAAWLILAKAEAGKAWESGRIPIFTGGTGLYFKALTQGLVDLPEISEGVRGQLRRRLENEGIKALYQDLEAKDPETAGRLKPADKQRIIRALEVFEATGKPLSRWLRETSEDPFKGVEFVKICLLAGPEILNQRIRARFQNMIKKGA
ncbi:MAG: tRNA (adenosine(37)-N6)-dimethylallyltransferase MiaA, partial [Proteobacteria bacterium]|nr:tRNA (adenosine(37)-N6)-dimethylallyltransferase MiaA [Pseudomonadota bacterium]